MTNITVDRRIWQDIDLSRERWEEASTWCSPP